MQARLKASTLCFRSFVESRKVFPFNETTCMARPFTYSVIFLLDLAGKMRADTIILPKVVIFQLIGTMPLITHAKGCVTPSMGLNYRNPGGRDAFSMGNTSPCAE